MHQIWLFGQLVILNVKKPVEQVPCAYTEIVSKEKGKWTVPLILVHSLLLLKACHHVIQLDHEKEQINIFEVL